ncbi:hypothetical protein L195_g061672, partial [Trifolium pratense]
MAPSLHFDKNSKDKKSSFLVMTQYERTLDKAVREANGFCPVVFKGVMSTVKEEVPIPKDNLEILRDFNELIADELPNDLPPMRNI